MSLMALRSRYALAGVVAMAAYLPLATQAPEMSPANQHTPILLCHGDSDPTARCPGQPLTCKSICLHAGGVLPSMVCAATPAGPALRLPMHETAGQLTRGRCAPRHGDRTPIRMRQ